MRVLTTLILTTVLMAGCGPKVEPEQSSSCAPYNLAVSPDHEMLNISWQSNCKTAISGYNIYISEEPLAKDYPGSVLPASIKPFNHPVFPGDTDPSDKIEHFEGRGLKNGQKYYVSVRTVLPDRSLSAPSKEIATACGVHRTITLATRYSPEKDGFSFEKGTFVKSTDLANDIYFFSKDGLDYLCSPHRLDGFLRKNRLGKISRKGDIETIEKYLATSEAQPDQERVTVKAGEWIQLRTVENTLALIKVVSVEGGADTRKITIEIAYSSLPGDLLL